MFIDGIVRIVQIRRNANRQRIARVLNHNNAPEELLLEIRENPGTFVDSVTSAVHKINPLIIAEV